MDLRPGRRPDGAKAQKTDRMNFGTVMYILLLLRSAEGGCDKCRTTVRVGMTVFPGSFVSHSHVNEKCYDYNKKEECLENGRRYYQVRNKGYVWGFGGQGLGVYGSVTTCPPKDKWLCINKGGQWDIPSILVDDYVDKVKETIIQNEKKKIAEETQHRQKAAVSTDPSIYQEIEREITRPDVKENLFIDLATRVAGSLNISNCWVCGGPHMSEQWPWRGESLNTWELIQRNWTVVKDRRKQGWELTNLPEGQICVARDGEIKVGKSPCQSIKYKEQSGNITWWPEEPKWYITIEPKGNCTPLGNTPEVWNCTGTDPYHGIPGVSEVWDKGQRVAPEGLFWICGGRAYTRLLPNWGECVSWELSGLNSSCCPRRMTKHWG
ncbi:uncharacterized protein LOC132387801 [Hypanus sabinus]|uniref:uncharacterized protein LOC132387801 n=1 Tax=Hypanus sabinus TaxID=79690 RepID=UPI0028C420F5|nr:uncharacterized protein LOC132387801 [Hypanus sabinus]